MSHEISMRANGKAEMAYVGETPWHGLGSELAAGASIDEWQIAAGMDWKIKRSFVRYATALDATPETLFKMYDKHVLVRSDTKAGLGVVSDRFQVVQPAAVLEFFRDLTAAAGFTLNTAGVLFGGKRFWALADIGETASIADSVDKMKGYLLLSTSCDGTMATEARYTNVRVVCNNTLSAARGAAAKVRVTHRSTFNASDVKRELGVDVAHERFAATMSDMRRLADTRLIDADSILQTAELVKPGASKLAREDLLKVLDSKSVQRIGELSIDNRAIGNGLGGVRGTQWGWLNAVTQYVDHEARARSTENRLNSAWFGNGADLKERAYEMALAASDGTPAATYTEFRSEHGAEAYSILDHVLAETMGK